MIHANNKLATIAAVSTLALVASCGGSGGSAELGETPEGEAFLYRDAVMQVAEYKAMRLAGMAREEIPLDEEVFVKSAQDLADISGMVTEGFMPEGLVEPSRASPDIWENWDDFEAQAQSFQEQAAMLAETAEQEGFEAARGMVQDTLGTCGDCHRPYRVSEAE